VSEKDDRQEIRNMTVSKQSLTDEKVAENQLIIIENLEPTDQDLENLL
jgi:hypothetical protein